MSGAAVFLFVLVAYPMIGLVAGVLFAASGPSVADPFDLALVGFQALLCILVWPVLLLIFALGLTVKAVQR